MFVVGLTGGVGSGKSTVAESLILHGASLIDADQVAREVVEPKSAGLAAIEARFGPAVVDSSGALRRSVLAHEVFSDEKALADLNAIVHPLVRRAITVELERIESTDSQAIVVLMVPLLIESGAYPTDVIVVVDTDPETALSRLVTTRGWTTEEARARMKAQLSRADRRAKADYVIENDGSLDGLRSDVDRLWAWVLDCLASQRGDQ